MPVVKTNAKNIVLVGGDDEFLIKEKASALASSLTPENAGEWGLEIIEGAASNADDAVKALERLSEALNTIGLFGSSKVVWFKNTNLLGSVPVASCEVVKAALADFNSFLKQGLPDDVVLLISAIGFDRRKTLNKTIEKTGTVTLFVAPGEGKHDEGEITTFIQNRLRAEKKRLIGQAFATFRALVATNMREIAGELVKLSLYVGDRSDITVADVRAVCTASRTAVIWELTDSLGARKLDAAVHSVENLLGAGEQPIGILMMLAAQFRLMLLSRDLLERRLVVANDGPNGGVTFVRSFERLSELDKAHFPRGKDGRLPNAWRLYRCALSAKNFSVDELMRAMEFILEANRQLVSTQLDDRLVLEHMMAEICRRSSQDR